MGGCLEVLFNSHRSSLKQDTLLNHQQLSTIIKPTTQNDHLFYSSNNLSKVEQFLTQFSQKPNMSIDTELINNHVQILRKFILDLKDHSSQIGKQIIIDKQNIESYIQKNSTLQNVRNQAVILRLEVQVLLLGVSVVEDLSYQDQWDLIIDIEEEQPNTRNKNKQKSYASRELSTSYDNQVEPQAELIQSIWVNDRKKQTDNRDRKNTSAKSEEFRHKIKNQGQLEEHELFYFLSKVVNKNSLIRISLSKVKRKKYLSVMEAQKGNKNKSGPKEKLFLSPEQKHKVLLGSTCLSVSDFIYYNSLIVSDVVSLNPPTGIKSSITTTSSSNANAIAFISLRGQGLRGETLQKDYIKIIKQHEIVIQQLQFCLEGQKGWQKLSQFRNSSQSHKNQSLYSQYTVPQQPDKLYRV